jgi:hypothetical protein
MRRGIWISLALAIGAGLAWMGLPAVGPATTPTSPAVAFETELKRRYGAGEWKETYERSTREKLVHDFALDGDQYQAAALPAFDVSIEASHFQRGLILRRNFGATGD